jgi:hypothetical protein
MFASEKLFAFCKRPGNPEAARPMISFEALGKFST